jgi:hypothetical protein
MEQARVKLDNWIVKIMLSYKKRVMERVRAVKLDNDMVRNSVRVRGRGRGIDKTISNRTNIESCRMFASRMSVSIVYWRMASYKG